MEKHEAMIVNYEDQIARMEKLVETSMDAATQALQRLSEHIGLVEAQSKKGRGKVPTKH